jgi:hypothetical protein
MHNIVTVIEQTSSLMYAHTLDKNLARWSFRVAALLTVAIAKTNRQFHLHLSIKSNINISLEALN